MVSTSLKIVSTGQNEKFVSKLRFHQTRKKTGINVWYLHKALAEMSEKQIKKSFHQSENHLPLMGIRLKIRFHQAEKQSQQQQECIKKEEKNSFHQPVNQLLLAGISLFFKNWIYRFPQTEQKPLNGIILFQLDRKSISTSRNGEFIQEKVSIRRKNCFH